jgi:hypothetical protein
VISAKFLSSKHSFVVCKQKKSLGPDLENTVDGEAIRSLIHAILPPFWLICDTVHCFDKTALFSSSNGAVFFYFIVQFKRFNNAM